MLDAVQLTLRSDRKPMMRVVEQGIPVLPLEPEEVAKLRVLDEQGNVVRASIEADGQNERGEIVWVRVAVPVEVGKGRERRLTLESRPELELPDKNFEVVERAGAISVDNGIYSLRLAAPGHIELTTSSGPLLDGDVRFQLWPDARSIVGAGAGTCRLADFVPEGWSLEEQSESRCLVVLKGRVPKYAAYTGDPSELDPTAQFDCELELICYASSPVIRFRWRIENYTVWQAYLERYTLVLPLAAGSAVEDGECSDDGKFLRYVVAKTAGGSLAMTADFVDQLGAGAGINVERRRDLCEIKIDDVAREAGEGPFEPHVYLSAREDDGTGLDLVQGGVNPPQDGNMAAENPEVHRLFYLGMGRTFGGSLLINCGKDEIDSELEPIYFEIDADYYSRTGALPENGDPVYFGEFEETVRDAAEWLLRKQWRGTLWWGEWWREYDVYREQGVESTANGNNPLAPLYHYWRTGDARFVDSARRSMEFVYDIQLSKRRGGLGPFFHSRRFLIDKMEWVHMRYQRIEGPIKTAHFLGDRRLRLKVIEAMKTHARNLVCPNGAPGYGSGGPYGKRVVAGSDCTNFGEVLGILYRETGDPEFLEVAKKMARWTIRTMNKWNWDENIGNSYGWHFLMRGMLSTIKLTGNKRYREWYLDMARKNMTYDMEDMKFVHWMNWLIVEAEKMSHETWMLDVLRKNTIKMLEKQQPDGGIRNDMRYPWSKWPTKWEYIYDTKGIVAYIPVMTARRRAVGLDD